MVIVFWTNKFNFMSEQVLIIFFGSNNLNTFTEGLHLFCYGLHLSCYTISAFCFVNDFFLVSVSGVFWYPAVTALPECQLNWNQLHHRDVMSDEERPD